MAWQHVVAAWTQWLTAYLIKLHLKLLEELLCRDKLPPEIVSFLQYRLHIGQVQRCLLCLDRRPVSHGPHLIKMEQAKHAPSTLLQADFIFRFAESRYSHVCPGDCQHWSSCTSA